MTDPRAASALEPDAEAPRLAYALPLFALLSLAGGQAGSALRYPEVGAALLFPPYAALTAALVVCRRLMGTAATFDDAVTQLAGLPARRAASTS